nr:MAG TPA: hypothetical protein [Caudoviricetes sp.]
MYDTIHTVATALCRYNCIFDCYSCWFFNNYHFSFYSFYEEQF